MTVLTQRSLNFSDARTVETDEAKHSSAATMQECGLDWEVRKQLVQYQHNGENLFFLDQYVLKRMDKGTPLSIVGKDYQPIQNIAAFDMFDNLTFIGGVAEYLRAGETNNGQKIFIHAKLTNNNMIIGGNDVIEKHIYLWNSHGGDSFKIFFVPFRLSCQNQLTGTFTKQVYKQSVGEHRKEITGVRIVHKGNVTNKMKQAQQIINNAIIHFEAAEAVFNSMAAKSVTETQAQTYYKLLTLTRSEIKGKKTSTRVHNQRQEMLTLFSRGKGNRGVSLWDAYNGATEWSDHKRSLKQNTEVAENRFFGSGATFKQKALTLATEVTQGQRLALPEGMRLENLIKT